MLKKTQIALTIFIATLAHNAYAIPPQQDIYANGTEAYAIDQENRIVRDNFGGCVRSIHWSKETALAECEGWSKPNQTNKRIEPQQATPTPKTPPQQQTKTQPPSEQPLPVFRGLFKTNSAQLTDDAFGKLDLIVEYMKKHPNKRIRVEGHTDSQGSETYNKTLSFKRAQAVKRYLVSQGIAAQRIEVMGYGESQPVADNTTPEGRQLNRRVEVKLIQ